MRNNPLLVAGLVLSFGGPLLIVIALAARYGFDVPLEQALKEARPLDASARAGTLVLLEGNVLAPAQQPPSLPAELAMGFEEHFHQRRSGGGSKRGWITDRSLTPRFAVDVPSLGAVTLEWTNLGYFGDANFRVVSVNPLVRVVGLAAGDHITCLAKVERTAPITLKAWGSARGCLAGPESVLRERGSGGLERFAGAAAIGLVLGALGILLLRARHRW